MGGASRVSTVDVSRTALAWAERNMLRVDSAVRHRSIAQDAFVALRTLANSGERFEIVIVDPPSYSTSKHGRFRATKDYSRLCVAALEVLADAGTLLACLNHEGVSRGALRRWVHEAARSSGREVLTLKDLPAGCDFPGPLGHEPGMKSVLLECTRSSGSSGVPPAGESRSRKRAKR
jgi:23S rRNA (cytosine1962-C5)-methyltransferase